MSSHKTVSDDINAVVRSAEELLDATANLADERIKRVRSRMDRKVHKIRGMLDETEKNILTEARVKAARTDQLVHDHPWHAVVVAAGVGLLIGLLGGRS